MIFVILFLYFLFKLVSIFPNLQPIIFFLSFFSSTFHNLIVLGKMFYNFLKHFQIKQQKILQILPNSTFFYHNLIKLNSNSSFFLPFQKKKTNKKQKSWANYQQNKKLTAHLPGCNFFFQIFFFFWIFFYLRIQQNFTLKTMKILTFLNHWICISSFSLVSFLF